MTSSRVRGVVALLSSAYVCASTAREHNNELFCGFRLRQSECQTWGDFFDSTDGQAWSICSSDRQTPCDCEGVECDDDDGVITSISLPNNNLGGTIPRTISSFRKLHTLKLFENRIVGNVPNVFSLMPSLVYMDLGDNMLSGTIPESLSTLPSATHVIFRQNNLEGTLPESFSNLTSVVHLNFRQNKLTGTLPSSYSRLTNMQNFILYGNSLTGTIPDLFGEMKKLWFVRFDSNFFEGSIPPSLSQVKTFIGLGLQCNRLSGNVPNLAFGDFAYCGIGGVNPMNSVCTQPYEDNKWNCPIPENAYSGCQLCRNFSGDFVDCPVSC